MAETDYKCGCARVIGENKRGAPILCNCPNRVAVEYSVCRDCSLGIHQ